MIPPQELKKKAFTKGMRGYEPTEVDEYIDFLIEKYTELFAQCDEYHNKLSLLAMRLKEIQSEEEAIHKLAIATQKQCDNMTEEAKLSAEKIIREAQEKAQTTISNAERRERTILTNAKEIAESTLIAISEKAEEQIRNTHENSNAWLLSTRTRCAKILNDFKKEITVQRNKLVQMQDAADNFNDKILNIYKEHLSSLSANMPAIAINLDNITESSLFDSLMQDIKNDAVDIADKSSVKEYDFQEELDMLQREIDNIGNIDDIEYETEDDFPKRTDEKIRESAADNVRAENEKTAVFTKVPETNDKEDMKVFAGKAASVESVGDTVTFDKNMFNNRDYGTSAGQEQQEKYEEEPISTYDDDDFQEQDYNTTPASSIKDDLDEEYNYSTLNLDNNFDEDIDDDEDLEKTTKKGFLGLFGKKKKNNKKSKSKNDDFDEEDDDEYDIDIDDDDDYK